MVVIEPVKAAILQCINYHNYSDAAFLSERLYAEVSNPDALFLLATSYYQMKKPWKVYMLLQNKKNLSSDCRFLLAKSCLDLNKLNEAEAALSKTWESEKSIEEIEAIFGDSSSFALQILGIICYKTERKDQAVKCFLQSLRLNPFLWSSFEMLCQLGYTVNPNKIFQINIQNLNSVLNSSLSSCSSPFPSSSLTCPSPYPPPSLSYTSDSIHSIKYDDSLMLNQMKDWNNSSTITTNFDYQHQQQQQQQHQKIINPLHLHHHHHVTTSTTTTTILPTIQTQLISQQQQQQQQIQHHFEQQQFINHKSTNLITLAPPSSLNAPPNQNSLLSDSFLPSITPEPDLNLISMPTAPRPKNKPNKKPVFHLPTFSPLSPSFGIMPLQLTPIGVNPALQSLRCPQSPLTLPLKSQSKPNIGNTPQAGGGGGGGVNLKPSVFSQSSNSNIKKDLLQNSQNYRNSTTVLRRSSRLFNNINSSVKENNNKGQHGERKGGQDLNSKPLGRRTKSKLLWTPQNSTEKGKRGCHLNPNKSISASSLTSTSTTKASNINTTSSCDALRQQQQQQLDQQLVDMQWISANGLMVLLRDMARGFQLLSHFKCREAVDVFNSLPSHHFNTGWVLCQVAKAYFELSDYQKAEKLFCEVRAMEPHRMEGMDTYSTSLWHLQNEVGLSSLAQDLTEIDKLSPEAWCATGNCFSIQKEHDLAIKFFKRAIQVNPNHAYAYTLLGHELSSIEELDKAMASFQNAIRIQPRHYNAWYGIGSIYFKQDKFTLSLFYYEKAYTINPTNSILLCNIAIAQNALNSQAKALLTLDKALLIEPKNPLCKFHRASILLASSRPKEALKELEELKQIVPKESLVYFLIGKIHKKMGNIHLALINFSWANDLDPKGTNNHIKESMSKRYGADEDLANSFEDQESQPNEQDEEEDEEERMVGDRSERSQQTSMVDSDVSTDQDQPPESLQNFINSTL